MLLSVDLGENMGWTLGPHDAAAPPASVLCATARLAQTTNLGDFLRSADDPIRVLLQRGVTRVAVEKPDTNGNSYFGIRKNMALLGHWAYWCAHFGIGRESFHEYSVTAAKLRLAGHGHADKDMMVAAALAQGYAVKTDHEADAVGIRQVHLLGPAETKAQRSKRETAQRKAAKAAALTKISGPSLL